MMRSLQIGKFFGIGVFIHWSFFLLPAWAVVLHLTGQLPNLSVYLLLVTAVFACVVMHEYGHALMARFFGIGTRDITLYPIGGVARLERMSEKPWEEFWIAVAGPAVNAVIAGVLGFGLAVAAITGSLTLQSLEQQSGLGFFFSALMLVNIMLILFNMLPAFPMDGGRVFRAIMSMWMTRLQATRIAAGVGVVIALVFGVGLFVWTWNPMIILVAGFVLFAGQAELRYTEWKTRQDEEEPLEVIPVHRKAPTETAFVAEPRAQSSGLYFQPRIAVYTWDNETGAWTKDNYEPS